MFINFLKHFVDFGNGDKTCDIVVTIGGVSSTITNGYTYVESVTPEITDVSPRRGGTMGGTKITITGTKFGSVKQNKNALTLFETPS